MCRYQYMRVAAWNEAQMRMAPLRLPKPIAVPAAIALLSLGSVSLATAHDIHDDVPRTAVVSAFAPGAVAPEGRSRRCVDALGERGRVLRWDPAVSQASLRPRGRGRVEHAAVLRLSLRELRDDVSALGHRAEGRRRRASSRSDAAVTPRSVSGRVARRPAHSRRSSSCTMAASTTSSMVRLRSRA